MMRAAALALVLAGCHPGAPLTAAYPAEDLAAVAVGEWHTGVSDACQREVRRSRVLLTDRETVRAMCRNPRARACVDYVGGYPMAAVWDDGPVRQLIVHELLHVLSRCTRDGGPWDHDHECPSFSDY